MDFKMWYTKSIQVLVILEAFACKISNLLATSSSGNPARNLTRVKKEKKTTAPLMEVCISIQFLHHCN